MFCCVWEMSGDRDRLLNWPKFLSRTQQHFFCILAGVAQPWVIEGRKAFSLQAVSHAGIPVSTQLDPPGHLLILFPIVNRLSLFFHLFTQVHVLIDGSVGGQYITVIYDIVCYLTPFRVILFYPTLSCWFKFLDMKALKDLYGRRR